MLPSGTERSPSVPFAFLLCSLVSVSRYRVMYVRPLRPSFAPQYFQAAGAIRPEVGQVGVLTVFVSLFFYRREKREKRSPETHPMALPAEADIVVRKVSAGEKQLIHDDYRFAAGRASRRSRITLRMQYPRERSGTRESTQPSITPAGLGPQHFADQRFEIFAVSKSCIVTQAAFSRRRERLTLQRTATLAVAFRIRCGGIGTPGHKSDIERLPTNKLTSYS